MQEQPMGEQESCASIVTLVRDSSFSAPSTITTSSDVQEGYPVHFNVALFNEDNWDIRLCELLSTIITRKLSPSRLVRCAHQFSDAIVFLAANLSSAITLYLRWLACCSLSSENTSSRPVAEIVIPNVSLTLDEFVRQCANRSEAGDLTSGQIKTQSFDNIHIKRVNHVEWVHYPLPGTDTESIAWKHIRDAHRSTRRLRCHQGRLWDIFEFQMLASAWEATACMPEDATLFTKPLSPSMWSLADALARRVSDSKKATQTIGENFDTVLTRTISIVGTYLTRHSFNSRHWTAGGGCSKPNEFAHKQFILRYQPFVQDVVKGLMVDRDYPLSALGNEYCSMQAVEHMIRDRWLQSSREAYTSCTSILEAAKLHIRNLRPHRAHLSDLGFESNCAACMLEPWTHLLPCGHGLCTVCLRACCGQVLDGCRVQVDECAICEADIGPQCIRNFVPPTAATRVLALDGGGVKGMVQLEVLAHLLKEIGLGEEVHLSTYFDLMVGSSIGGICALGLGTRGWSLQECREKFLQFSQQIFAPKSRYARFLSRTTSGWFDVLVNAFRLTFFNGIYDSGPMDTILRESFGDSSYMIQPDSQHHTKVAVVVNEASSSETTIFSNYNKLHHPKTECYAWPATDSHYQALKIWQAARATSAAPGFWNPISLLGKSYQDGGLSYNNPCAIAINEGNLLATSRHNKQIIISVGCGRLYTPPLIQTSVFRRFIRVFEETLNAQRQHEAVKLLTKDGMMDLIRLNPKLDLHDVTLDDISSVSSLSASVEAAFTSCSARQFMLDAKSAARRLLASLFYFELDWKLRKSDDKGKTMQKGFVRTRLRREEFESLRARYPDVHFRIGDTQIGLSLCAEVEILYTSKTELFNIEIVHRSWAEEISGSPFSIAGLQEAQCEYLPLSLCGRLKRKRA